MIIKKIVSLFSTKKTSQQFPKIVLTEALSDAGLVRTNNEDSYFCLPQYHVWAVADGMGGYEGGEIASAIAITSLKTGITSGKSLTEAIQSGHRAIEQAAVDGLGSKGMGSTIVALQILHDHYQIAWVGDSRAYLFHKKLRCLSKDHSYVQLMLDQGLISEEEAENHPHRNTITQALGGTDKTITVDTIDGQLQTGDIFLLCSDGLSGKVSSREMELILSNPALLLNEKANLLTRKALDAGGDDNITLILLEVSAAAFPINKKT